MKGPGLEQTSRSKAASVPPNPVSQQPDEPVRPAPARLLTLRALPLAFLLVISVATYLNADRDEFLFDDSNVVLVNPTYDPTIAAAFQRFWRERSTSDAPLTYLTFAFNHAFNRTIGIQHADQRSFLIVNSLIHGLNAWLVYLLVLALLRHAAPDTTPAIWVALVAGTLFAVHPIHASSVAYIIQRRGSLATLFYLLGVLAYLRARGTCTSLSGATAGWPWQRVACALAVPLCFWLSACSKSLGLTLPLTVLAIELCLRAAEGRLQWRQLAWLTGGAALCAGGLLLFLWRRGLFNVQRLEIRSFGEDADWGPWAHFLTESRVFVHYWKLLLLPLPRWSCLDHDFQVSRSLLEHGAIVAIILHGVLIGLAVWAARRRCALAAVGVLWFYIALVPYVLLPQSEIMVEYKTYLPGVGAALIVAEVLWRIRGRVSMYWQVPVIAVVTLLLLGTTVRRNAIYRSSIALWSDAVAKSPAHARPRYNLGDALTRSNRFEEAIVQYNEATRLRPDVPQLHDNLGVALLKFKKPAEAIPHFKEALRLDPRSAEVHNNLGTALWETGRRDEALREYREAVRLRRDLDGARTNLGTSLAELADALSQEGRTDEAIDRYREAAVTLPSSADIRFRLGSALAQKGLLDEAIRCYEEAVRIKPDYAEALTNLGNAFATQGRDDSALAAYEKALKINPRLIPARLSLAYILEKSGKIGEAIAQYEAVLQIDPGHARARAPLEALRTRQGK